MRDQSGFIKKLPAYRLFSAIHSLMITRILETFFFMLLLPAKHTAASLCQERLGLLTHLTTLIKDDKIHVYKKISCVQDIFGNALILWTERYTEFSSHGHRSVYQRYIKAVLGAENLRHFSEHFHFSSLCPFMSILPSPHAIMDGKHHPGSLFVLVDP
jgi:hypothetical protein